ncbi:hypothetical protein N7447_001483 [Penicillium robsamsonii]|uniref:uncharacterized protein n=1 Tax=Penicillium robsamsonii TaxID=1792511 RepID=UPI0025478FC6|nr:uncharacterized protein N7447_001483 [Penicillium robsamsonii]KAJ5835457.1 hypothetical protein N7447_001483 [Penicillium robsamsonii]
MPGSVLFFAVRQNYSFADTVAAKMQDTSLNAMEAQLARSIPKKQRYLLVTTQYKSEHRSLSRTRPAEKKKVSVEFY